MFTEIGTVITWFFQSIVGSFIYDFVVSNKWVLFAFMLPGCLSLIMLFAMGILRISTLRMPQTRINNFIEMPRFPIRMRQNKENRMIEHQTAVVDSNTGEIHIRKSYTKTRKLTRKERKTADEMMFDN